MKTIKVQGKDYQLPESWHECQLKQAIKVSDLEQQEDEFKVLALISGYANIPIDDLKHMKIQEIKDITNAMLFVLEPLPEEPIAEFDFNGKHYYTIESFLTQESQDFFTTESILQDHQQNTYRALPELLAVMCKQKNESLDDYDLKARAKEFEDLPMDIANGIRVFFYALEMMSQINSQSYLNRDQIIQAKAEECRNTLNMLAGGGWYGRLLKKTLLKYLKSLEKDWMKYSSTIQSQSNVKN